ncbi:MAG TPA: alpha/beta hydrolase [Ignavibacteriales bacterium]|nr:alpha/beta hydrolase [Ignavibacteriales bacterium]
MKILYALFILFAFLFISCSQSRVHKENFSGIKNINGEKIYCQTTGDGEEDIVVVHGGPGLAHNYLMPHFKELSDNYRLIYYDQRGSGLSEPLKKDELHLMDSMVSDLEGVRKAFNIEKMNLAGQSFGALIAINYALKYPQNVKTLLLLEPAPGKTEYIKDFSEEIVRRLSDRNKEILKRIVNSDEFSKFDPEAFKAFLRTRFKAYFKDTLLVNKVYLDYFDEQGVKKFFGSSKAFEPYFLNYDLYAGMGKINCPVLIIHGALDPVPEEAVEKMASAIKGSELHIIPGSGHFVHIENPQEYFSLIRSFLEKNN